MKPFDIERAKAGDPVVTRDGRKVRILCYDKKDDSYPIVALIENEAEDEFTESFTLEGKYWDKKTEEESEDLFMAPIKKTMYVNLYKHGHATWYECKEDALKGNAWAGYVTIASAVPVEIEV